MNKQIITESFTKEEVVFLYDLISEIWANGSYGNGLHNGKVIKHDIIKPLLDKTFGMYYEVTECI